MAESVPRSPLLFDVLENLLGNGEDWLMRRILVYAKELGYAKYTSTFEEAWRLSIQGLSSSLLEAARVSGCDLEIRCEEDVAGDPAVGFGVHEARLHRSRGIPLSMFYSFMKYYAQSYRDLCETLEDPDQAAACAHLTRRFFDRVEIGFASEWAGLREQEAVIELQDRTRALTDEKIRYLTIYESLNVPVVLVREDGMVENINEAAATAFGMTGVTGSAYYSHVAVGEPFAPLEGDISEFLAGEENEREFERPIETFTGSRYYIVRLKRMLDVSGKFRGLTVVLSDVTDRKRVEDDALQSRAEYRALFENTVDAFAQHAARFSAAGELLDYEFTEVNPAFEELFGLCSEDVVGKSVSEIWPPGNALKLKLLDSYAAVTSGEASMTYEVWSEPIGKWLRVTSFHAGADGRFATVFRDVTMQKETERALEVLVDERTTELTSSLEELAEANRVKDDFLASMSHELRTPLNSVIGFSGILSQGMAGPLNDEQLKQVAIIRESGERLLGLVNDVLDLSRIESGRVEVSAEEFDLVSLVASMVTTVEPMAEQKSLELRIDAAAPIVPMWTDREKVAQIVLNLLSNAIKYTTEGSVRVGVQPSRDGVYTSLTVEDTGCGIPLEDIDGLFDRFSSVRGMVRRVEDGAGLGLSISRRLATLLGGTLSVESTPGEGSLFTLYLPVRHADA